MTTWTLDLPYDRPPLSLNDRGQSRGARQARSRIAAEVKAAVKLLARHIGPQEAIHVRLHWQPKDRRRRDPDNQVATLKPCIDGLVAAGVVPDDCPPYVDWSAPRIHEPAPDRRPRVWLVVTAVNSEEDEQ